MKVFWFSLVVILLLSITAVFAQSDVSATSVDDEETAIQEAAIQNAQQVKKVIDMRKVVINGPVSRATAQKDQGIQQAQESTELGAAQQTNQLQQAEKSEQLQFDEKGGAIIPNASEGIRFTSPAKQNEALQNKSLMETKGKLKFRSSQASSSKKVEKDLRSRKTTQDAPAKSSKKNDN